MTRSLLYICMFCTCASASNDWRIDQLERSLEGRPVQAYAVPFIRIADRYQLDWRLLPALTIVETSGGKHVRRRNNWFGWDSGQARFQSVTDAAELVAFNLSSGFRYHGKSLRAKLQVYNHESDYPDRVLRKMALLGPKRKYDRHRKASAKGSRRRFRGIRRSKRKGVPTVSGNASIGR